MLSSQTEMEAFDRLAPEVRRALSEAIIPAPAQHVLSLSMRVGPAVALLAIRKQDRLVRDAEAERISKGLPPPARGQLR